MDFKNFVYLFGMLTWFGSFTYGQVEVCMFYNLHADCYYRVDSMCLSHIIGEINQCSDPIEVTFKITCKSPKVDFEHTFSSSDQVVSVPGYDNVVELHVKLAMKEGDTLNVEADFIVSGRDKTDFVNNDVELGGLSDNCPLLNRAAKIAVGIMGGLVGVAAILILVLLYVRRRRNKKAAQNTSHLITNAENPGQSTPRSSVTQETLGEHVTGAHDMAAINRSDNSHVAAINRSDNGHVSGGNGQEGNSLPSINRQERQHVSHSAMSNQDDTNVVLSHSNSNLESNSQKMSRQQLDAVRYSDILKGNQFKISDC